MPHATVPDFHRTQARRMRSEMTEAELKFWNAVRAHRLGGLSFRRQFPIGGYIVDFACPERKLIVELDGLQHVERSEADLRRTRDLEARGWHVLRFWNGDVICDLVNVCRHVLKYAGEETP